MPRMHFHDPLEKHVKVYRPDDTEVCNVVQVDTDEGWLIRYARDNAGRFLRDQIGGELFVREERIDITEPGWTAVVTFPNAPSIVHPFIPQKDAAS
jgi:hypothetical protein